MLLTKAKYLSNDEYRRLLYITNRYMKTNTRDCLLIKFAMFTGARAQEILNVNVADLSDNSVYIKGLKGGLDRDIPLDRTFYKQLKKLARGRKGQRLFPIGYQRFYVIWCMYRPVAKNLHGLRHSFAVRLYRKTKDVRLVKYSLGHKSITSTQIYIDFVYAQSELRKAFGVK